MSNTKELKDIPFFYILSMGRSGSTLLEFLLDAHPHVNIPIESRFIIHLYYKYYKKSKWNTEDKKLFILDLYKDYKLNTFWEVDQKKLEKEIINSPSNVTFFELCRIITANYISFYPKEEIKVQGNKNPIYSFWSDKLYELNNDAKFIHLVRKPLSVIASHKKFGYKNLNHFAYRWNFVNLKINRLQKKNPNNFITIKYENLIQNPEQTLKKICEFLDITYSSEQLNFYKTIKRLKENNDRENNKEKIALFNRFGKNLIYPIDSTKQDSWQTTLTSEEKKDISFITNNTAKKFNYIPEMIGEFKIRFIYDSLYLRYRYIRNRLYYRFSLSIKE